MLVIWIASLPDSWVLEKDFDDLTPIRKYWQTKRKAPDAPAPPTAKRIKLTLHAPNSPWKSLLLLKEAIFTIAYMWDEKFNRQLGNILRLINYDHRSRQSLFLMGHFELAAWKWNGESLELNTCIPVQLRHTSRQPNSFGVSRGRHPTSTVACSPRGQDGYQWTAFPRILNVQCTVKQDTSAGPRECSCFQIICPLVRNESK